MYKGKRKVGSIKVWAYLGYRKMMSIRPMEGGRPDESRTRCWISPGNIVRIPDDSMYILCIPCRTHAALDLSCLLPSTPKMPSSHTHFQTPPSIHHHARHAPGHILICPIPPPQSLFKPTSIDRSTAPFLPFSSLPVSPSLLFYLFPSLLPHVPHHILRHGFLIVRRSRTPRVPFPRP